MVKPGPVFLPWMAPELSDVIRQELESNNVKLHTGYQIERIKSEEGRMKVICSDISLDADMVIAAIGIKPNSELAADAGINLSVNNAIATDRMLKTSDQNIYAAGDCADAYHIVTDEKTWIPLAPGAAGQPSRMGRC